MGICGGIVQQFDDMFWVQLVLGVDIVGVVGQVQVQVVVVGNGFGVVEFVEIYVCVFY